VKLPSTSLTISNRTFLETSCSSRRVTLTLGWRRWDIVILDKVLKRPLLRFRLLHHFLLIWIYLKWARVSSKDFSNLLLNSEHEVRVWIIELRYEEFCAICHTVVWKSTLRSAFIWNFYDKYFFCIRV